MLKNPSTRKEAIAINASTFPATIKRAISLITLLTLTLLISSHAQTPYKNKLDEFFDRLSEKNKAMGTLSIAKDGKILYSRSIGYTHINETEKKPLTPATRYRVGSITKMFTAAMIFQLVEEGKLKLDDTLDKFFPQIADADKITISHILAHRSGIHDVSGDQDFRSRRLTGATKDEMIAFIAKGKPDFEPGTKYAYSNSGYYVLGMVIEKLTGKRYDESLQNRIVSKIGLKDTYSASGNIDANKNESFSYKYILDWTREPETNPSLLSGSGSLVSTPADLTRFIQALFDVKLISQASLDQMIQQKMGMDTFMYNGKTAYGHTGGIDGFGSWLAYLPEEKLALAYSANGKVYPVSNIIDGAFDIYWNKPFTIPSFESLFISPEVLDQYTGVYITPEAPVKFTVRRNGATLLVQVGAQSAAPLEPVTQDLFKIESAGMKIKFDAEKKQMTIIRSGGEKILTKEN